MEIIDREREKEWLEQMDTILIFVCHTSLWRPLEFIGCQAALFAGFLSAFLIELLGRLEQDPIDIIQDVLISGSKLFCYRVHDFQTLAFRYNGGTEERESGIEKSLVEASCKSGCPTGHS